MDRFVSGRIMENHEGSTTLIYVPIKEGTISVVSVGDDVRGQDLFEIIRLKLEARKKRLYILFKLEPAAIRLPDQIVPLEHVEDITVTGDVVVTMKSGDTLRIAADNSPEESHWLQATLRMHAARYTAAQRTRQALAGNVDS